VVSDRVNYYSFTHLFTSSLFWDDEDRVSVSVSYLCLTNLEFLKIWHFGHVTCVWSWTCFVISKFRIKRTINCSDIAKNDLQYGGRLSLSLRFNGHFPGEPGLAGFIGAKDNESGGDNWRYKTWKAPVKWSPTTNQHPAFYRLDVLPVTQPTVSTHWRESSAI